MKADMHSKNQEEVQIIETPEDPVSVISEDDFSDESSRSVDDSDSEDSSSERVMLTLTLICIFPIRKLMLDLLPNAVRNQNESNAFSISAIIDLHSELLTSIHFGKKNSAQLKFRLFKQSS